MVKGNYCHENAGTTLHTLQCKARLGTGAVYTRDGVGNRRRAPLLLAVGQGHGAGTQHARPWQRESDTFFPGRAYLLVRGLSVLLARIAHGGSAIRGRRAPEIPGEDGMGPAMARNRRMALGDHARRAG